MGFHNSLKIRHFRFKFIIFLSAVLIYGYITLLHSSYEEDDDNLDSHRRSVCMPKTNIAFLKVHKCASTSVANILMRFGEKWSLSFLLPNWWDLILLGPPNKKFSPVYAAAPNEKFNILCHHTRWSDEIPSMMPVDTEYLTMLREPTRIFESLFQFGGYETHLNATLEQFVEAPGKYYRSLPLLPPAWNPMAYDLGLEIKDFKNDTKIKEKIEEIDGRFGLVMLADRFEESLILMKDRYCWNWTDIVSVRLNERKSNIEKKILSKGQKERIRKWNRADSQLYDFFHAKFHQMLEEYGKKRMRRDVKKLRKLDEDTWEKCAKYNLTVYELPKNWENTDYSRENQTGELWSCKLLVMHDYMFTDLLRKRRRQNTN